MAAERVIVVAKIVLGLALRSVRTDTGRRDDVVMDVDPGLVALDGHDRDTVRRRGAAASLGDLEAQRNRSWAVAKLAQALLEGWPLLVGGFPSLRGLGGEA
jgi:hypothetical protein